MNLTNMSDRTRNFIIFLITFLLLFSSFTSPFFQSIKHFDSIYVLLQCCCFFISIFHFKRFDKMLILITLYYLIYLISTVINGGTQLMGVVRAYIVAFNLLVITKYYMYNNPQVYFKIASFFFYIILFIEIISMIFYPNGLYDANNINPHYFLGHRNNTIEYLYPAISIVFISHFINYKKNISHYLFLFICLFCVIATWSANSIIALLFTIFYIKLNNNNTIKRFFNYWHMFYITIIMFFSFIIFKIQNLFKWFIEGILHKSLTFTGRSLIWDKSIEWIKKSSIYGYGNEQQLLKKSKIGHINSCHNYFLDFMYTGGIIMLSVILFIVYFVGKELSKNLKSNNDVIKKIAYVLSGISGGYFIIWFATPVHLNSISYMFLVFYIIYNLKNLKLGVFNYE